MSDEKTNGLHPSDVALLTGPYVPLTPSLLDQIREGIEAHQRRYDNEFPQLVELCPYDTRLAVTCWAMTHIYAHAKEGGSYRTLIYDRLGFGPDAYAPCMFADGLNISNELCALGASEHDQKLAQAIDDAADALPVGEQRDTLLAAYFRFTEMAAHVAASVRIIDAQRAELVALIGEPPRE